MVQAVRAKKHLGQHFLTDLNIAANIVQALVDSYPKGNVLEIGPGTGVLTQFLLPDPNLQLWAAEVDAESINYLQVNFPQLGDHLLHEDFLEINLSVRFPESIAVIGNFPYNISSQIVFHLIENRSVVPVMVGMFQKEVAERIGAAPGGKAYGILSVITQAFFDVEYLFTVHEHVFNPPPKVKSGVIRLIRKNEPLQCDEMLFRKVVKTAFNQRRKKLRNAISVFGLSDEELGTYASKRAEELSIEAFSNLTNLIANHIK